MSRFGSSPAIRAEYVDFPSFRYTRIELQSGTTRTGDDEPVRHDRTGAGGLEAPGVPLDQDGAARGDYTVSSYKSTVTTADIGAATLRFIKIKYHP